MKTIHVKATSRWEYAAMKAMTLNDTTYAPGDPVDLEGVPMRRVRQMLDTRKIIPLYMKPNAEAEAAAEVAAEVAAEAQADSVGAASDSEQAASDSVGAASDPLPGTAIEEAPAPVDAPEGDAAPIAPETPVAPVESLPPAAGTLIATHKGFGKYEVTRVGEPGTEPEVVATGVSKQDAAAMGAANLTGN